MSKYQNYNLAILKVPFYIQFRDLNSFLSIFLGQVKHHHPLLSWNCNMKHLLQAKCLETTARWSGVSAPIVSTCIASWNGWTRSRSSSSAPCADRSGSSRSEPTEVVLLSAHIDFHRSLFTCLISVSSVNNVFRQCFYTYSFDRMQRTFGINCILLVKMCNWIKHINSVPVALHDAFECFVSVGDYQSFPEAFVAAVWNHVTWVSVCSWLILTLILFVEINHFVLCF